MVRKVAGMLVMETKENREEGALRKNTAERWDDDVMAQITE